MQPNNSPKVLLVNPYGIGDALFCTPLIRTIKKCYPNALIGILLGSRTEALFEFNRDINQIHTFNKDTYKGLSLLGRLQFHRHLLRDIRQLQYETLIDLSNTNEYSFLAKTLWQIPHRIGFKYKKRGRHLTQSIPLNEDFSGKHVVEHYFQLLSSLNIYPAQYERELTLSLSEQYPTWKKQFLKRHQLSDKHKIVTLIPGGGASWGPKAHYKYWPIAHYASLIKKLIASPGVFVVLAGGPDDHPLCDDLVQSLNIDLTQKVLNLSGKTSIQELANLLKTSHLVIGTESGPLHMATALNRPAIALYGPVDPKSYGPYTLTDRQHGLSHAVPCSPCYKQFRVPECDNRICLSELTPERVYEQACLLLQSALQSEL